MNIISYQSVGRLNFKDDYATIKKKLETYDLDENIQEFMGKRRPRIYIMALDLMINFQEDGNSVRFFEFFESSKDIYLKELSLKEVGYDDLEKEIRHKEQDLELSEDGFTSKTFGFRVGRCLGDSAYTNELSSILVFNKDYLSEPEIDLNELYKSIMGDNYEL